MSPPTKILYIDEAFGFGGSTTSMAMIVRHLDRTKYDPLVVLSYKDPEGQIVSKHFPDTTVILMSRPYLSLRSPGPAALRQRLGRLGWLGEKAFVGAITIYNLFADFLPRMWQFFRLIRRWRVRVVHANNAFCLNQATILASLLARVPFVCHVRFFEQVTRFGRWLFHRADAVIVNCLSQKEDLVRQGLNREKIHVVPEGLAAFELNRSNNGRSLRHSLGFSDGTPLYGIVGMLVPWKGHKVFLEAVSRIARQVPDARAVIVGETITSPDPYGIELRQMAKQLGLNGNVFFLGLRTDTDEVYAALDVFVHASVHPEPFGRVLIEAMGYGKPVVATRGGGPDEIVIDGETGFLVPRGNAEALAEAIIRLLRHPELRLAMGKAGHDRVATHFTATQQARAVEQIYQRNAQEELPTYRVCRSNLPSGGTGAI